ncbi:Activator of basal transcription 1 [Coemansia sp. RSA 2322]|uniref:18S rRNA factor 2 n=1 Tax=Coemansia thaxteri TaxID=2663907 RepID=A0A9W8B8P5_9FUNG|nr:Activator of basal transcription 1 [Coemansia thaxteri]KAJ2468506.1 Activator of basal transcription 1 [Coemansia sp. RSA 2322]KAJ2480879.1 Activator of basal transcription 1 [Coemansia sp. RSA 2320]
MAAAQVFATAPEQDSNDAELALSSESEEETSRTQLGRSRKRSASQDSSDGSLDSESEQRCSDDAEETEELANSDEDEDEDEGDVGLSLANKKGKKTDGNKPLSEKEILRAQQTERRSGVVYMSRVPPFMKPIKVRQMLQKYGDIGRIYLVEEEDKQRKRRVKGGGNRKRQFTEGWIEFANKKYAKAVASMLNNTQMGGKKHGFYHDDLWNLKYLPKFKWRHLTEQLASERAAKEQRLETEVSQSRRELDAYLKNVERAQKISSIKKRRDAKIRSGQDVKQLEETPRNVWQRDVVARDAVAGTDSSQAAASKRRKTQPSSDMASILGRIF